MLRDFNAVFNKEIERSYQTTASEVPKNRLVHMKSFDLVDIWRHQNDYEGLYFLLLISWNIFTDRHYFGIKISGFQRYISKDWFMGLF